MELRVEILLFCIGAGCTLFGWVMGRVSYRRRINRSLWKYVDKQITDFTTTQLIDKTKVFDIDALLKERDRLEDLLKSIQR